MKKILRCLPTPLILLAFMLSFVSIYSVGVPLFHDTDLAWHIAAGDLIRHSGSIPVHDSWSFSGNEQTWYNISWLWDIMLSVIHDLSGVKGLFIFSAFGPALIIALLLVSLRKRCDIGVNATIFMGLITGYCMLWLPNARPQIAGMFFALTFHHILHLTRKQPHTSLVFLLPLVMVLWVNIHGSFFAAFIIIGAYGIEAIITKNIVWLRRLLLVGVLCLLASLINPYGIYIVTAVARTLDSVVAKYLVEWQPFVFGKYMGISLWILAFIGFSNLRADNTHIADKILAVVWLLALLFATRNITMLVILGAPYLASNLPADNLKDANTRKIIAWINDLHFSPILAGLIPVALISSYFLLPILGADHYLEDAKQSPMPAINYVAENYAGKRVLNDYDYGGRIIYETRGKIPIAVDGRAGTVYSEEFLQDFLDFINLNEGWQQFTKTYNIEVILLGNGRAFVQDYEKGLYHDLWQKTFSDEISSVFVRK